MSTKRKKLKIAMLASNLLRIPPTAKHIPPGFSGAPEAVVSKITEGLVARGHNVTLFASKNSKTKAKLFSVYKKDSYSEKEIGIRHHLHFEHFLISQAYRLAKEGKFDIIHSHFDVRTCGYAPFVDTPTVSTLHSCLHGFLMQNILKFHKNTQFYVSISDAQRKPLKDLNYIDTVYHGINSSKIKPSFEKGKYFITMGRIVESKGNLDAIKAIMKTDEKLLLMGMPLPDSDYWKKIKPYIDGKKIIHIKFIPRKELFSYVKGAKALILPAYLDEPFGLTIVEAMACGTPVIAYRRGSIPELVKNKKTGFVVSSLNKKGGPNIEGLAESIKNIDQIDRKKCRYHIEENFTIEKMIDGYEEVYYKILNKCRRNKK